MSTINKTNKGFTVTVEKIINEEKNPSPESVCPRQLGERIVSFIESHLTANEQITVKLTIENWDETYQSDEFMLGISSKDFSTNYWI